MNAHDLTKLLVSGLGAVIAFAVGLLVNGLRADLRTLAATQVSNIARITGIEERLAHLTGKLEGKGLI